MGSMIDALEGAATAKPKASGGGSMARMLEGGGDPAPVARPKPAGPDELDKSLAPEGHLEGWVKPAAKKLAGAGTDLVDLVFTGLLAPPLAAAGQLTTMIQGELNDALGIKKSTRRERAQAGLETAGRINKALGTPVRSLLTSLGYLSADDAPVEEAMGKVMSLVERDAAAVEERTGGKVLKEDVLGAVNVLFGGLGAKGTQVAGKQVVSAKAAKAATKALEDLKAERASENLAAEEAAAATKQTADEAAATAAAQEGTLKSANLKPDYPARPGTQQRYADPNQLRVPADDALGGVDPTLALAAAKARKARRSEVRAAFAEDPNYADFSEGQAALADRARDGTQSPPVPGGPTRLDGPDYSVGMAPRRSTDAVRLEADPVRGVVEVQDLSSALTKVADGRAFDLTAVERLALRASKSVTDPKVITAAAVGATGLGLAMAMGPDADEAALAVGAGALMLGRGKGLTLDAMTKMGEATPLGVILDQSATTLSTLEKLPRNRFEFSVQSIQELLKRQEVTKAERDVFAKALEGLPAGGMVTAKNLMVGVKKATQDFELTKKASDEFADYGLTNIGRTDAYGAAPDLENAIEPQSSATHIYQVPDSITLGTNNHFGDPQYFGHTRVFEEGGVRHVVELQSDLAQKAGKALDPEVRARLERQLADVENQYSVITKRARAYDEKGATVPLDIQRMENRLEVELSELRSKLDDSRGAGAVEPMLKNWYKRLIREELADGARAGETQIRFADADTVAKVEGWPAQNDAITQSARRSVEAAERNLSEMEARLQTRGGATPVEQAEARELLPIIREDLQRAQKNYAAARDATAPSFHPEHQSIYDRYAGDVTKFLKQLGGKHVVDSAGHGWWEVPVEGSKAVPAGKRVQQFGGASQDLLKAAGIIGGSVVLVNSLFDPENKTKAALWTAAVIGLGMWAKSRVTGLQDMAKTAGHRAEDLAGNFSSEMRDISPAVVRKTRRHAWQELKLTYDAMQIIGPFIEKANAIPSALREPINLAVLTGKSGPVIAAFGKAGKPELVAEWVKARNLLGELGKGLVQTKRLTALLDDYYPRVLIDYPGLMQAMGKEAKTYFDKLIEAETKKALRDTGAGLSPVDLSILINKHLERGHNFNGGRPGFLKKRSIEEITAEYAPFYAPFTESLPLYVRAAIKEIQTAKFFGKDLVRGEGTGLMDIDASVGNVVLSELQKGKITPEQFDRMQELLKSRFGPGERAADRLTQTYRNATNVVLLGDVFAAASNLADIGPTVALHELVPTIMAAAQMVTKNPLRITAKDMGMAKHIAEEFVHGTRSPVMFKVPFKKEPIQLSTSKFVDTTFKLAGWRLLDIGPKELMANAAVNNARRLVTTEKGVARFQQRYGEYFGDDFGPLLSDLRSGKKTELTTELGIHELADAQPIFKTEVPNFYNKYPNARFMYILHTYPIKQLNLVRDRGFKEIARGNKAAGLGFLFRYAVLATASGVAVTSLINFVRGRDTDLSASALPFYALRNFGFSHFVMQKFKEGKSNEAIASMVMPPIKPFIDIITGQENAIAHVPLVGKGINDHLLGASEKANARLEKQKAAAERKAEGLGKEKEE